jgi:hypothetical protein
MDKYLKNLLYLIILVILIVITIFVLKRNHNTTLPPKSTEFAVKDTQNISKIFLADMSGNRVLLERTKNGWIVNGKFEANQDRIELLLETIASIEVKNPVPIAAEEYVIKNMSSGSTKVEIYTTKKKPVKVYYVGGPTQDYLGTYMMLDVKKKVPYVMHKPGLNGYVSEGYYFTDEAEWRTKEIFKYDPADIVQVRIEYFKDPSRSFILKTEAGNTFKIETIHSKANSEIEPDQKKAKRFLIGFSNIQYMEILNFQGINHFKDSILKQTPVIRVSITDINNKIKVLSLFLKPKDIRTKAETDLLYDPAYFYAIVNDRSDQILIMQSLVLERILWKAEDFKK